MAEETNNEKENLDPKTSNEHEQKIEPEAPSAIPGGKLGNALMRTFRGDIKEKAGQHAEDLIEQYVPNKGQPVAPRGAVTRTRGSDEEGKKENIVRTYKQDVQHMVRNRGVSMTKMAALEGDRAQTEQESEKKEPWKTTTLLLIGGLFIVIGLIVAFGAYFLSQSSEQVVPPIETAPGLIFTEARERIDLTNRSPKNTVQQLALARRNVLFSLGSVVELFPTIFVDAGNEQNIPVHIPTADFLKKIDANVSDVFLQTLGQDYMLGIHVVDENVPFLILTSRSYGHTFNGMLQWEPTIESDLSPFFSPNVEAIVPAIVAGDTTFVDTVVQNLDVRILRDEQENIRMLYSFIDRNTVVITTNIRTLIELASRLQVQH